jgi:hypothetical protein
VIAEASITGLFKTLLIIIGAFVVLRFLGQLMVAKRNMEEERTMHASQRKADKDKDEKLKNFGKTKVILNKQSFSQANNNSNNIEDVDFEEIK